MRIGKYLLRGTAMLIASGMVLSGCAINIYKQSPRSRKKIKDLQTKVDYLEKERKEFEKAKHALEKKLRGQIESKDVSLMVDDRGLVIILSDDILFDSGKAELKDKAYPILDKVARVIKKEVPDKKIGIGGHTDNVPITYSGWQSNWELSTARATNVLHYLESRGISPEKLSATGYGQYRSIASNATEEGRARNRRVEIVILPEFSKKKQTEMRRGTEKDFLK